MPDIIHTYSADDTSFTIGAKSRVGRGGMQAKVEACMDAVRAGVRAVVIASGYKDNVLRRIIEGVRAEVSINTPLYLSFSLANIPFIHEIVGCSILYTLQYRYSPQSLGNRGHHFRGTSIATHERRPGTEMLFFHLLTH